MRSTAGSDSTPWVARGVDLVDALPLERPDDLDQGAAGVDLVVDDDRPLAPDLADDVHQLGPVEIAHRGASR